MHLESDGAIAEFVGWINGATSQAQLDCLSSELWQRNARGDFADEDATRLSEAIDSRRPSRALAGAVRSQAGATVTRVLGRLGSRFAPRQRQMSPDRRASRERRRQLGGSGALPDCLRPNYTEGQRSVLTVIAGEARRHGVCDLPIDQIAALAGVCRTTVQATLHEARRLGHVDITERPQRGRKNLTNLVRIASAEWRAWNARRTSGGKATGSKTVDFSSPTKKTDKKKERGKAIEPLAERGKAVSKPRPQVGRVADEASHARRRVRSDR